MGVLNRYQQNKNSEFTINLQDKRKYHDCDYFNWSLAIIARLLLFTVSTIIS